MTKSTAPALVLTVMVATTALSPLAQEATAQVPGETPVPSLTTIRLETIRSRDEDLLRDLASALSERYPDLLAGTEILFTRVESFGTVFYRMDIQGIEGEEAARDLCRILEMEQCLVARPGASLLASPEAFSVAPDGLVDMTAPVSGSVEAPPLPTQGAGWSPVEALEDTLTSLPLDRPDPEVLRAPVVQPWEEAVASAEMADAAKPGAAPSMIDALSGVASSVADPVASSQATEDGATEDGATDDGASLDLDGAIEHARSGGSAPPKLALDVSDDPAAQPVPPSASVAPVVSVAVTGADGTPVPLPAPEADGATLAALAAQVREAPMNGVVVMAAGPDTIRPRPRPTTGVFAQADRVLEGPADAGDVATVASTDTGDGAPDVVVAVVGPDTIRPRPRPTTGVFAQAEDSSQAAQMAQADAGDAGLPKPVWEAGPRPTVGSPSAGQAVRKASLPVAPVLETNVADTAPLRSVPSPRPSTASSANDGRTRTQALALAVEEARAARVAERLAKGGDPTQAPSSATTPVVAIREDEASVASEVSAPSVLVALAGPDTPRPRPRPTTGVFAELAASTESSSSQAPSSPVSEVPVDMAEGEVGTFRRPGAAWAPVPGLRPASHPQPADVATASLPERPEAAIADAALAQEVGGPQIDPTAVARSSRASRASAAAPDAVPLSFALPGTPVEVAGFVDAWGIAPSVSTDAASSASAWGAVQGPRPSAALMVSSPTSLRFHTDVALADTSGALLAFRVPRSNAFARWALGTVAFAVEDGAWSASGVLPEPVRVVAVPTDAAARVGTAERSQPTALADGVVVASARAAVPPSDASLPPLLGDSSVGVEEMVAVVLPMPALRPAPEAFQPEDTGVFASLADAGRAAQVGPAVVESRASIPFPARALAPVESVPSQTASTDASPTLPTLEGVALEESDTVFASRLATLILVGSTPLATPSQPSAIVRVAGVEDARAIAGQDVPAEEAAVSVAGAGPVVGVEVALASADTPRPRMRPTTGVFALDIKGNTTGDAVVQDPAKLAALFPALRPSQEPAAAAPAEEAAVIRVASSGARVRPDAVPARRDDRPIHGFLDVWGVSMPWTEVQLAQAQPRTWGAVEAPVEVVDAVFAPTARLIAGEDVGSVEPFRVLAQADAEPRTLEEFVGILTAPDAVFEVPSALDFEALAEERRVGEAERALLASAPTGAATVDTEGAPVVPALRPTADSIAAASQMATDGDLPSTIRATIGAQTIALETDTRRVVAPRKPAPVSRFAVALSDTYAMPFDLTGSGVPALQRMPLLRPAVVDGADAPIAATLVAGGGDEVPAPVASSDPADMARFFPAPGSVEAAPVVADVFQEGEPQDAAQGGGEGQAPSDDAALAMMDKLRGGLDETLTTLEIPVDTPPEEVVDAGQTAQASAPDALDSESLSPVAAPVAPGPSRPALDLPPLSVDGRPSATAPLVETAEAAIDPSVPVTDAPVEGAEAAPRVTTFDEPSPVPFAQDSAAVGVAGVPGSTGAASPGQVAMAPNEALMIRLTYASSEEAVKTIVASLKDSFPPSLLKRGRFFGKAAPASPGLFIVGIEANTAEDMAGLVAYMQNNGIPYVLSGQSAAPILAQQP